MLPPSLKKLKSNLLQAKAKTEQLISQELKANELENLNKDNLLQGKDSEGDDLPFYSITGKFAEYGYEKTRMNPLNRGRWDLKLTGQYHSGIKAHISKGKIRFKQRFNNLKTKWIAERLEKANRNPLGITEEQYTEYLETKKPKMQENLMKIIKNGL